MFSNDLMDYIDAVSDEMEVCVVVRSIATTKVLGITCDIAVEIGEYGELILTVRV